MRRAKKCIRKSKLLYESWQAVIKLFNEYSSIASAAKCKTKYEEGLKM